MISGLFILPGFVALVLFCFVFIRGQLLFNMQILQRGIKAPRGQGEANDRCHQRALCFQSIFPRSFHFVRSLITLFLQEFVKAQVSAWMGVQVRDCLKQLGKREPLKIYSHWFSVQLELCKLEGIYKSTDRLVLVQPTIF